jgi:hypothetical protein
MVILIKSCAFVVLNCNNRVLVHGMENVILAGENGTFDTILKSKYFIQAVKFWVAHLKVTVTPPEFPSLSCAPLGGSMADVENR